MVGKSLAKLPQTFSKWRGSSIGHRLRPRTQAFYDYLQRHRDRIVSKDELLGEIWRGRVVTEQSLFQCVAEIRALRGSESIRTVPGRGYQWIGASAHWPAVAGVVAFVLLAVGVLAGLSWQTEGTHRAQLSPIVAVMPATNELAGIESALATWLSRRVPAELITGPAALARERAGESDVTVRLSNPAANVIRYSVRTLDVSMKGELAAADTAVLVERIGAVVREALLQNQRSGSAEHKEALFAAVLAAWMDGDVGSTVALADMLLAQYPDFLPGHSLMLEVEVADDRLAAANDRANSMISEGADSGSPDWLAAGYLALSKIALHKGILHEAEAQALTAIEIASNAGLSRQAGKAAEFLAAVGESRAQSQVAINWLVEAHQHYTAGRCTVGTARVDQSIRDLISHTDSTG